MDLIKGTIHTIKAKGNWRARRFIIYFDTIKTFGITSLHMPQAHGELFDGFTSMILDVKEKSLKGLTPHVTQVHDVNTELSKLSD